MAILKALLLELYPKQSYIEFLTRSTREVKQVKKRLFSIALILLFSISLLNVSALAAVTSSQYISVSTATAEGGNGSGYIKVNFDITGLTTMTDIGATKVEIKNSSGSTVYTFTDTLYPSLMGHNRTYYSSSAKLYCTANQTYYAVVTFYAGNSSGSDSFDYTTNSVTT